MSDGRVVPTGLSQAETAFRLGPAGFDPSREELPTVVSEGVVRLGDLEIVVIHLSNGERVIEEGSLHALLTALFGERP